MTRALERLSDVYHRNGVLRVPNLKRRRKERETYHHGYEIRFVAFDEEELARIRRDLKAARFLAGSPYEKSNRVIVPIYGKAQVLRFLELVGYSKDDLPEALRKS